MYVRSTSVVLYDDEELVFAENETLLYAHWVSLFPCHSSTGDW